MSKFCFLGWVGVVIVFSLLLSGCGGTGGEADPAALVSGDNPVEAQEAVDSPLPTENSVPPPGAEMTLTVSGSDRVQVGNFLPLTIDLQGDRFLGELWLEVQLPLLFLQVVDVTPETPVIEVAPEIPEEQVLQNEVDEQGILHFAVKDVDPSLHDGVLSLCMLPLQAQVLGSEELVFISVTATDREGRPVEVTYPTLFLITVQEEPVAEGGTEADALPTPEPTDTSLLPTSTAEPVQTPTVTWTPAPLPPLSEVSMEPITPEADSVYYRIHPKQTLYRLSQTFDVPVEAIAEANGIQDSSDVKAGTVLRIPVRPPVGRAAYLVSSQETLYGIAHAFGMTVEELAAMNHIGPASYHAIKIGQWLVLLPEE